MLHDLDKTFENLLYEYGNLNRTEVDISFELPNRDWSARLSRPTINCWCFNIRENLKLRDPHFNVEANGNMGRRFRGPRRMDFTYLVTAWARKAEDEHQLIWRALASFKRFQSLDPRDCEGDLRYSQRAIPLLVATEGEHPINLADLWSVVDNDMRLGFTTVATLELDLEFGFESPLVLERMLRVGQSREPREETLDAPDLELKFTADDVSDENDENE